MRIFDKLFCIFLVMLGTLGLRSPASADLAYTFTSGTGVAVTGSNYSANGALNLSLAFAPTPGTNLTVVNNTGLSFISGTFNGVPQGGTISLTYNGVTYNYVANYYGGNGRSLLLQWPCTGLDAWGANYDGQLGNNSLTDSANPVAVVTNGALNGKTVVSIAAGETHSLALTSDGEVFSWGNNQSDQLGNSDSGYFGSQVPVAVNGGGVLTGKTVVAVAAGCWHNLALTSDGQVYAWGYNRYGQLGNNTTTDSFVPVAVSGSGALAGKTVVAIAAGGWNSLALTSDGQVFGWGATNVSNSSVPVLMAMSGSGVLAGKTVVAIAQGGDHSLGLTSDGQVFAWGWNAYGQLGNNTTTDSSTPVAVSGTGMLAGKAIVAIAAGGDHCLALSFDGQVFAWGLNAYGQLGNNSTTPSLVPVAVSTSGALAGKKVVAIAAGGANNSLALTSDGQLIAWGDNREGELGTSSTTMSLVPVAVSPGGAFAGKAVAAVVGGYYHNLAMFNPGAPSVIANPVSQAVIRTGTSNATATFTTAAADSATFTTQWQVSTTGSAGVFSNILNNPSATTGTLTLTNLTPSQNGYAYRAVFTNTTASSTATAATLTMVNWQGLAIFNSGTDVPATADEVFVSGSLTTSIGFAPAPGTNLTVINNTGTGPINGTFSNLPQGAMVSLSYNGQTYPYIANYYGGNGRSLVLVWGYQNMLATFTSGSDVPLTENNNIFVSGSLTVALAFAPTPGTNLTVINNTGLAFISGTFSNVAQGGTVPLTYNGATYNYIANYYGGNGRSLVLQWSCIGLDAWGYNGYGQLGNGTTTHSLAPVGVNTNCALAWKTVVAVATGYYHNLALSSDGQVFAWGYNGYGQLGNSTTTGTSVPVAVNTSGLLAGKTVVAVAAGSSHSLALSSDGQVFAWGYNKYGQLGNSGTTNSSVPVAVSASGVMAGKIVVAIAAGQQHSLALTSDGQVFAWGYNADGELGNSGTTNSLVPVAVNATGVLAGKTVVEIAANGGHSLALTSDGRVFAWGYNADGASGSGNTTNSSVPVAVNTAGVLSGKTLSAIAAGGDHTLALASNGSVFAWGGNWYGQLGNNSSPSGNPPYYPSSVPVAVITSGAMAGKTVTAIAAGGFHSLALSSDGQVFAWGDNSDGQLGNNQTGQSSVPVAVSASGDLAGKTVVAIAAGAYHSLAIFGSGPPVVTVNPVNQMATSTAPATFTATATNPAPGVQWQVSTTGTAGPFSNITNNLSATTGTLTLSSVTTAQSGYAYQAVFTNGAGSVTTAAAILTVVNGQDLVATFTSGTDVPLTANDVSVSGSLTVLLNFSPTPETNLTVINNVGPGSIIGTFSNVPQGGNVSVAYNGVTYNYIANYNGGNGRSLVLEWNTQNLVAAFTSGTDVPLTTNNGVNDKVYVSGSLMVVLGFAPTPGTNLTVINNVGQGVINGTFSNVPQGGAVSAIYNGITYNFIANYNGGNGRSLVLDWNAQNLVAAFTSGTDVPLTANYGASDQVYVSGSLAVVLGFAPTPGTNLTVINNVGPGFINGTFSNVPQGGAVSAIYNGVTYNYVANYKGGNGKSLVLDWNAQNLAAAFTSGTDVPVTANNNAYDNVYISGSLAVALSFAPAPGTNLTVICNAGPGFINGTFSNVPQGGTVLLTYNGVTYNYVANYYGGNGRSLVLQWPCTGLDAWGYNWRGQLGNNTLTGSLVPAKVNTSGALFGKAIIAVSSGAYYGLALAADGQIFGWGYNADGELGNSSTTDSLIPAAVNTSGALAGKTIVSIAAGWFHGLASSSDGRAFAWGNNTYGQLGNSGTTYSSLPVAVNVNGVLAGKKVVAVAGGTYHSLALTSDGQIFGWGYNGYGQLGNSTTTGTSVPVAVNTSGLLAGKTVVAVAAGGRHSLALTLDGQVYAWGYNGYGQLGNNSTTASSVPVAVSTTGVLAGKTVVALACGDNHSLALTSDGQVFGWGSGLYGELGNNSTTNSAVPVAMNTGGALAGKRVVSIAGGEFYSLALTSDGQVYACGYNNYGQLGNSGTANSSVPVAVSATGDLAGKTVTSIAAGFDHSFALFGSGPPAVIVNPASQAGTSGTNVFFTAAATDNPAPVIQWQVSTTGAAGPFSNIANNPSATTGTLTLTNVTTAQNGWAYQAVFTNWAGSSKTTAATLTVYGPVITVPENITLSATGTSGAVVAYCVTANDSTDGSLIPRCIPASGSMFPIGTTNFVCSASNSFGITSTASFTVTVQHSFATFQSQYGLLNSDPTADPNHTGVCNLMAYAFSLDPSAPDRSQLPSVSLQGGCLQVSYVQWTDVADLTYTVEVSDDLQTWHSGPGYTGQVSATPLDIEHVQIVQRDLVPITGTTRRFIRVRIAH